MSNMSKIIISYEFPPRIGGAGIVALDIATALLQNGEEVRIITSYDAHLDECRSNTVRHESINGIEIIRLPVYHKLWFLTFPLSIKRNCKFFSLDDDIIINDFGAAFSFSKLNEYHKYKFHLYVHGKESFIYQRKPIQNILFSFSDVYKKVISNANSVIFVSEFIRTSLLKAIPDIAPLTNSSVIHNSIDETMFEFVEDDRIPEHMKLELSDGFNLVTACRLVEGKGFDRMLDVFTQLKHRLGIDISWFIIGDGDYKEPFMKKLEESSISGVYFLGRIERSKLKYYYSQCDMFLLLSSYEEAYPLVYHEAQACKLPVVGMNLGGVPEVIKYPYGFLVDDEADAVNRISLFVKGDLTLDIWPNENNNLDSLYRKISRVF